MRLSYLSSGNIYEQAGVKPNTGFGSGIAPNIPSAFPMDGNAALHDHARPPQLRRHAPYPHSPAPNITPCPPPGTFCLPVRHKDEGSNCARGAVVDLSRPVPYDDGWHDNEWVGRAFELAAVVTFAPVDLYGFGCMVLRPGGSWRSARWRRS